MRKILVALFYVHMHELKLLDNSFPVDVSVWMLSA